MRLLYVARQYWSISVFGIPVRDHSKHGFQRAREAARDYYGLFGVAREPLLFDYASLERSLGLAVTLANRKSFWSIQKSQELCQICIRIKTKHLP